MGRHNTSTANIPEPVRLAQKVLQDFQDNASYDALRKVLPALAMQMEQANIPPTEEILHQHAQQGLNHIRNIQKSY